MRTTIKISDEVYEVARRVMRIEGRKYFSNLCEVALVAYCSARGHSTAAEAEVAEEEVRAAIQDVGSRRALAALKREARRGAKNFDARRKTT